jgi:hypothetical protein
MVLRASEAASWLVTGARMSPNSDSKDVSDHAAPGQAAARLTLSFNHQK